MLEALIRTKKSKSSEKKLGDVICLKLKEFADWGSMEIRVHNVVDWQDEELEKLMREKLEITGIPQVLTTPYKQVEHTLVDENMSMTVTRTRSSKFFDFDSNQQKVKTEEEILTEFQINKAKAIKQLEKIQNEQTPGYDFEGPLLERYREYVNLDGGK